MTRTPLAALHRLVWTALMAALIAAGAFLHFPLWGVPFSLQMYFTFLAGLALGPLWGVGAVGLYILAGLIGLPVFAGGRSGLAVLLGPTGGYIFGFLACALIMGLACRTKGPVAWSRGLVWGLVATLAVYVPGVLQLKSVLGIGWDEALTIGVAPFAPLDIIKLVLAIATQRYMSRSRLLPA